MKHFTGWAWGRKKWGDFNRTPSDAEATEIDIFIKPLTAWNFGDGIGGGRRGAPSSTVTITVASDVVAPAAPTATAKNQIDSIELDMTKPTTNADGTVCRDFNTFKIYAGTSSGIDITNPSTYTSTIKTSSEKHIIREVTGNIQYFVVTAVDFDGNESAASSEISSYGIAHGDVAVLDEITETYIADDSISTPKLKANSVTADKITVTDLSAINADLGAITAGSVVVGSTNKIWLNESSDGVLAVGGATKASAPFYVSAAGALTATGATITGSVTISSGSGIGNLSDAGALALLNVIGSAYITDLSFDKITAATSTASLTIGSGGYLQSSNYASGSAGFKISGAGDAEFNDVTVRGALIAGSGSSINGRYIDADSIHADSLLIDDDISFKVNGTKHSIYNIDELRLNALTEYPYISISQYGSGIGLAGTANASIHIYDQNIYGSVSGTNANITFINSWNDQAAYMAFRTYGTMRFQFYSTSTFAETDGVYFSGTHTYIEDGYIPIDDGQGNQRFIRLWHT